MTCRLSDNYLDDVSGEAEDRDMFNLSLINMTCRLSDNYLDDVSGQAEDRDMFNLSLTWPVGCQTTTSMT